MSTTSHLKKIPVHALDLSEYDIIQTEETHLLLQSSVSIGSNDSSTNSKPFTPRHWTYKVHYLTVGFGNPVRSQFLSRRASRLGNDIGRDDENRRSKVCVIVFNILLA